MTNPNTQQARPTPPSPTQEERTPPSSTQEERTPPSSAQEERTPPSSAQEKKSASDKSQLQYALYSAFIYPGAGQLARRQKGKGIIMAVFFSIFLVIWGYLVAKGLINLYSINLTETTIGGDIELGTEYLKRSLIPGAVAAIVFIHSVYDAYKG